MKKTLLNLAIFAAGLAGAQAQLHLFTENMGSGTGTQAISATTFQNSATLTYSGTGDTRTTTGSTGYTGASGGKNVFLTNNAETRNFEIGSINTLGYSGFSLSFGAHKQVNASNMSELSVNGVTVPTQPTGSGTANWRLITMTPTLANSATATLDWVNSGASTAQFRIDDVTLTAAKLERTGANAVTDTGNVNFSILSGTVLGSGASQTAISLESNLAGGVSTTAAVLDADITDLRNVTTSFTTISAATNDSLRVSDVFNLSGTTTDTFALQLTSGIASPDLQLGWLSGGEWVESTVGNSAAGALAGFHAKSWASFVADNGGFNSATMLGAYGNDGAGSAWSVVNHNSAFALVVIPEPHEYALMFAGLLGLVIVLRRMRRNPSATA